MKILWLTWKDQTHPLAGGAEVVNEELAKRLVRDGHSVTFIVGGYKGAKSQQTTYGYRIVRLGNRYTVYWQTYRYYKKHLVGWADLVIDEVNTVPFFAKFYIKEQNILFIHQLARGIWFYQMIFPLSLVGYLVEPIYLRLLSNKRVITVSNSTKKDLMRFGFDPKNIHIISEGIQLRPVPSLGKIKKYDQFTVLSVGAVRPMKRTLDMVKAFELLPSSIHAKLIIAGDANGHYGYRVKRYAQKNLRNANVEFLGKITERKKIELMQKAHLLLLTSFKEGWCLVVTEAASQGTPAIVYDVDGLRDSVRNGITGCVVSNRTPQALADTIVRVMNNNGLYMNLRSKGWQWSKEFNFDRSHREFIGKLGL